MRIYHTSPDKIIKINSSGMLGECLCFSASVYCMSACEVIVYALDIEDADVVEASSFFYRDDYSKLDFIVSEVMDLAGCDEEEAQELISQRTAHSDAEIDWRIQGYAGEAAKVLGFKAAEAQDEQGTVYIVPMQGRENDLIRTA